MLGKLNMVPSNIILRNLREVIEKAEEDADV
jgi:hypothetical protein